MSLSTTGTSAAAIACAISPPIVPAPTTAALKTNKLTLRGFREPERPGKVARWSSSRRPRLLRQVRRPLDLPLEGGERALQRASLLAADEEPVGRPHERSA